MRARARARVRLHVCAIHSIREVSPGLESLRHIYEYSEAFDHEAYSQKTVQVPCVLCVTCNVHQSHAHASHHTRMRVTCAITSGATVASAWCAAARIALLCILQEVIFRDLQREMKKLSSWRGVRLRARACACVRMCVC